MGYFRRVYIFPFVRLVPLLIACVMLLTACTTDRHVVTGGLIQKRKYRPGWHLDFPSRSATPRAERNAAERPRTIHAAPQGSIVQPSDRPLAPAVIVAPLTASAEPVQETRSVRPALSPATPAWRLSCISAQDGEENLMPKKKWNVLAVPVFVLGLGAVALGFVTASTLAVLIVAVITVVLGAIALRRIRSRDQAGKGFALIGFILGLFVLLFVAISIASIGFM